MRKLTPKINTNAAQEGNYAMSDIGRRPAPKGQDIVKAEAELTGVRRAAIAAGYKMAALERDAEAIHTKTLLSCTARVVSTPE